MFPTLPTNPHNGQSLTQMRYKEGIFSIISAYLTKRRPGISYRLPVASYQLPVLRSALRVKRSANDSPLTIHHSPVAHQYKFTIWLPSMVVSGKDSSN
jgi:hypothetical protein